MSDFAHAMSQHRRTPSSSSSAAAARMHAATASSSAVAAAAAAIDTRPSYLDESALSSAEFDVYSQWLATIKPARSGEPEHVDEQDALRFLRDQCAIGVHDEIRILSLFERFPLGLLPGHFYALLRLASWVQRGEAPSKALLFTQTSPPRLGLQRQGHSAQPYQQQMQDMRLHSAAPTASNILPAHTGNYRTHRNSMPPVSADLSTSPRNSRSVPPGMIGPSGARYPSLAMQPPLVPINAAQLDSRKVSGPPPPVPDDSHKPGNPFRTASASHAGPSHIQLVHAAPALPHPPPHPQQQPPLGTAILGFDPAPNPFKQTKPKLVKPTPIVANASTQVLGRPSAAPVDPFKSGQSVSSHGGDSPVSGRSIVNATPPLSALPGADLRPPPLPPRHISPLIQASLNASRQVRRKQEALPPKTFTVLQSSQSRHPSEKQPRLLTGQTAPPPAPAPPVKRRSITDTRQSSSSMTGGQGALSTSKASEHVPDRRAGPLPPTIAPKPSYGGNKTKTGVPAWLQEQEVLQRSSLLEHHNEPSAPPPDGLRSATQARRKKRTTSAAQRIQFLDDESDSSEDGTGEGATLSEQARSAASIDRNNPFFQHGRDLERSVDLKETLGKLAVENAVAKAEQESRMSVRAASETSTTKAGEGGDKRLLGRSKTLRDGSSRLSMLPPVVPPRKRSEAFPAPLHAGTYPGFGRPVRVEGPTSGGLRQNPTSRKAEVGLPAHVLAERERLERERMERATTVPSSVETSSSNGAPPPPPRRRTSSNSQVSVSDGNTPLSPSDEMSPPVFPTDGSKYNTAGDALTQDYDSLAERQSWFARMTDRVKAGGNTLPVSDVQQNDDEAEVDEQYLREQRQLHRQQQRQQRSASTIEPIREEDSTTPTGRREPSGPPTHPSLSQRRATDSMRRSLSGAGGLAGLVRRSSLLARNSFAADDVVSSDTDDDGGSTPGREKEFASLAHRPLSSASKAPDVDAVRVNGHGHTAEERRQDGWQPL